MGRVFTLSPMALRRALPAVAITPLNLGVYLALAQAKFDIGEPLVTRRNEVQA